MKKLIFFGMACLVLSACSKNEGSVKIELPENFAEKTLVVSHVSLDNMFNAKKQEDLKIIYDTLKVENGIANMKLDQAGAARYEIESPTVVPMLPEFYASPDESLEINIKNFNPLDYDVKGTALMEDIMALHATTSPIQQEYVTLINTNPDVSKAQIEEIWGRYDAAIKKFIKEHPKSPALPLAMTELSGDDFKVVYDNLDPEARKSILMPFAESFNREVVKMQTERAEEEAKKAQVASGTIEAPAFTLPDLNGKMVSLSDFRGKWVVLDFWGTWCGWCIKGFPALKKAYEQYGDKIVVIGIDCNEPEAEWKAGVKKYDLPWINLYNGQNRELYDAYNIEGFPTKAIINPEGKLVDLTTGEDPSFYTRLENFVK